MSSEPDQTGQWERIAQELRACKELQRKAWGGIEDATLGRYLAGDVSGPERATVENALEELPELRKLTDLVRDVLNDLEPVVFDTPSEPVAQPHVLAFAPKASPGRRQRFLTFLRQRSSFVAAACLLLICGLAMPRPGFLSAPRPGDTPRLRDAVASRTPLAVSAPMGIEHRTGVSGPALKATLGAGENEANPDVLFRSLAQAVEFQRKVAEAGSRGELAETVPQLHQAHQAYQRRFGRNHPATKQTARTLAGFYQVALNAAPAQPFYLSAGGAPRSPSQPIHRSTTSAKKIDPTSAGGTRPPGQPEDYRKAALVLRDQITNRSTQEVQTAVVPVLTEALQTATNSQERMDLVRAIAVLGPAAANAVSALTERLENSDDPNEVRAVLEALNELGPAAREAVPTLVAMCRECSEYPAGKAMPSSDKREKGSPSCRNRRLTPSEGKLAEKAVASLNSPEGRSGIDDQAGCFSVRVLNQSTRAIREAARKAGVEVLFSTACSADAARKENKKDEWKASRLRAMGKRAIHVVFDRQGTVVDVHVSEALRRAGVTPEKVRKCLLEQVRQKQYDKALDESVKFVTNIPAKKK